MKKLPSGVSNFETLIEENYYYVDKTKYIQKLEDYPNRTIIFLRPRKFGKTLFTSVLENYYDVNKKEKFDTLFGETYIGKNPTTSKNSYHILKFNFSGIGTDTTDSTLSAFKQKVIFSVDDFVQRYKLSYVMNENMNAEEILNSVFYAFKNQKPGEKIYVIIDEYDHFANELLSFNTSAFKELVSRNGKVRKWYETLKEGTESVVDRIFITGVAPITLDSMTSGFNIASDITKDIRFNNMMGFSKEEIEEMMDNQNISKEEQEKLMPIMKENYDGYKFSSDVTDKLYNSNMTLYFLNEYIGLGKIPDKLVDVNIASDYAKIGNMLKLCNGEKKLNILSDTLSDKGIISEITDKFNPEVDFGD
ncbi:MAG: AAA family ATPase, partial [Clostridia bacterium]|nr:AAA family ATPase [Clostridia bacterium]